MTINFTFIDNNYTPNTNFIFNESEINITQSSINQTLDNIVYDIFVNIPNTVNCNHVLNDVSANINVQIISNCIIDFALDTVSNDIFSYISNDTVTNYSLDAIINNNTCYNSNDINSNYILENITTNIIGDITTLGIDWIYCANENETVYFPYPVDVAYGEFGQYSFLYNVTGYITFSNSTFGDPIPWVVKKGYYRLISQVHLELECNINHTLNDIYANIICSNINNCNIAYNLNDITSNISCFNSNNSNIAYNLNDITNNISCFNSNNSNISYTLDDISYNINCVISVSIISNYTLDNIISSDISCYNSNNNNSNYTLDNIDNDIICNIQESAILQFNFGYGIESRCNLIKATKHILSSNGYYGFEFKCYFKDDVGKGITNIDLDVNSCCYTNNIKPSVHETWHIELDNAEYYDTHYWQRDKTIFRMELSARPRLSFHGYYGFEFNAKDKSFLLVSESEKIDFYYGMTSNTTFFNDDRIKLCKGNFIPDSENVNIELADTLLEDCYITPFYYGFQSECSLATKLVLKQDYYYGIYSTSSLTTYPKPPEPEIPKYKFYYGIESYCTLATQSKLDFNFGYGFECKLYKFKEPTFSGYYGFTSHCSLYELLDVEILDSGDLLNEYKYMDENGDEIKEKFTKAVVELYPYQHWINARCVKPLQ